MKKLNIKKLTLTALFAAVAVVGSLFSFPVFGAKCAPVQHLVNILCAVLVGPWWGLAAAFIAALSVTFLHSDRRSPSREVCAALCLPDFCISMERSFRGHISEKYSGRESSADCFLTRLHYL